MSPLPLQRQLSRLELYDTTIMPCRPLMARIVYLSLIHFFHHKGRQGGSGVGSWGGLITMGRCLSAGLSLSLDFQIPRAYPRPPSVLVSRTGFVLPRRVSVCAQSLRTCVFAREAKFQALAAHCQNLSLWGCRGGGYVLPTSATDRFPLVPKKQSGAAWPPRYALLLLLALLCRSITLPITDVICH